MRARDLLFLSVCVFLSVIGSHLYAADPETGLAVPTVGQLAWHEDEIGVFYHMNPTFPVSTMTFANFDPVAVIDAAENVGAKHIVLVAKHVNGFCWWPSQATRPGETENTLNIAMTQYQNGTGDVVRELFDEARSRGIRPGLYLSPYDQHFGSGGSGSYPADQEAYNDYYMTQATELATQYGELAEWWLDGSVVTSLGDRINALLATEQPNAVVFQGTAATLRWVGNERGTAPYPIWNTISQSKWNTIQNGGGTVSTGDPDGVRWVPAEADTHLSTGWFSGGPRSLSDLMDVYYRSVGHGVGLLLNYPVLADGSILSANVTRGIEMGNAIDEAVGHLLFTTGSYEGSSLTLDFGEFAEIDHVIVEEELEFGERVRGFDIDGWDGSQWVSISSGQAGIGRKQIRKFTPTLLSGVRLTVTSSVGTPKIRSLAVTRTGVQNPDTTPPSAPTGLAAAVDETRVTLSWQPAFDPETGINQYYIYRDGVQIGTAANTTYRDINTQENQPYSYTVSAENRWGLEGSQSDPVQVTTGTDQTAPTLLSATTLPGRSLVLLMFSEPVAQASAENVANYDLSHGRSVTAVTFDPAEPDRVELTVDSALAPDILYTLRVNDIVDLAPIPHPIAPGTQISFFIDYFNLVSHWKLDDGTGTTALDSVASGANNADVVGATWTAQGRKDGALSFDGDDYLNGGGAGIQGNSSIALWVYPTASGIGDQCLVTKDRSGVQAYQMRLYLNNNLRPGFMMSNEAGEDYGLWRFEDGTSLPLDTWSHLAMTQDGTTFNLYVNGALVESKTLSGIIQSPYNPADLLIGARWNSSMTSPLGFFTGKLDDVRLYAAPLPPEEIQQIAAEADGVPTPPEAPTGLAAVGGDGQVELTWTANSENDLDSYTVYRSEISGNYGSALVISGITANAYTDTSVSGTTYYYLVTATDTSGNESADSGEVSAAPTASSSPITLNSTLFDGTEPETDGNASGFRDQGTAGFDTVNGWTWATSDEGDTYAGMLFTDIGFNIGDQEIRVGPDLATDEFRFDWGNGTGSETALAQAFALTSLGDITVTYDVSDNAGGMYLYIDDGSGIYASQVHTMTNGTGNSYTFTPTSLNIRIAVVANDGADSNAALQVIEVQQQRPVGDISGDGRVNLIDFGDFAQYWQVSGCNDCSGADLTGDGNVYLDDLHVLVEHWLQP